jgi:ribosome-associated protein
MDVLQIRENLQIPYHELHIQACRSSGPGGQHVNTSSTKVRITWNPSTSTALSEEEKLYLLERLSGRISKEGEISCASQEGRSQQQNLENALDQMKALILRGLFVPKDRVATKPTRAQKERRLREKKEQTRIKSQRSENKSIYRKGEY